MSVMRFRELRYGPYSPPRYRLGDVVIDEARGEVLIVGTTSGRIPWPLGAIGGARSPVLYADLARAVQQEANVAVQYHWGVTGQTVTKWRKSLGVPTINAGTLAVRRAITAIYGEKMRAAGRPTLSSPERAAKIAAAKVGKPRSAKVQRMLRQMWKGRRHTSESRSKMSAKQRARGAYPPAAGPSWPAEHIALLGTMMDREVAARTGRTISAVKTMRQRLRISARYRRGTYPRS